MRAFLKSFGYAVRGIAYCVRYGRNLRIQLVVGLYVLLCTPGLALSRTEWAALLIVLTLVPAAEMFNTAVERTCDQISREFSVLIKFAKDAAAGAVLFCAVGAAAVGAVLFTRPGRLSGLWAYFQQNAWYALLLAALLIPAVIFIATCRTAPTGRSK